MSDRDPDDGVNPAHEGHLWVIVGEDGTVRS
jgi:hypothetical protein